MIVNIEGSEYVLTPRDAVGSPGAVATAFEYSFGEAKTELRHRFKADPTPDEVIEEMSRDWVLRKAEPHDTYTLELEI